MSVKQKTYKTYVDILVKVQAVKLISVSFHFIESTSMNECYLWFLTNHWTLLFDLTYDSKA